MAKRVGWSKRVMLTVLVAALAVSLAACSSGTNTTGAPEQQKAPPSQPAANETQASEAAPEIDKNNTDAIKVTLAGGSVGGFWSGLGQAISKAFGDSYPGSAATYEPGSGAGNVKLVDEGKVEIGLVQSIEVTAAKKGLEPFTQKYENLTALATLYDNAVMQISVRKEFAEKYNVNSFEDIVNNKVPANIAINQKGNLNSVAAYTALESYGITEETLKEWGGTLTWAGSSARFEAIQNGRADISVDLTFAPDSKISETSINTPLVLWSLNENAIKKIVDEWSLNTAVIPKGTYEWQEEDIQTIAESSLIIISSKTTLQDQYKMAKALVDNLETLKAVHPAMNSMTKEKLAATGSIPLAPGAKQLYEDVGAIK